MIKFIMGIFVGWLLIESNAIDHAKNIFVDSGGRDMVIEKLQEIENE